MEGKWISSMRWKGGVPCGDPTILLATIFVLPPSFSTAMGTCSVLYTRSKDSMSLGQGQITINLTLPISHSLKSIVCIRKDTTVSKIAFQFINNPVSCDGEIATHRKMLERGDSVEAAERRDAAGEPNIK